MVKKILVSQPAPTGSSSPYFEIEKDLGVKIDFASLIHVERVSAKEFRAMKVSIPDYTAIVFNSHHAVDHFFSLCKDLRVTMRDDMKYFFISENIALYIQKYVQYRKRKIFFGRTGQWDDLIELMQKHKKERFLIPQSDVTTLSLREKLDAEGLMHTECTMYKTVSTKWNPEKAFDYDMVVFFTPSGVKSLVENFPDFEQGEIRFACWGSGAAKEIAARGFRLDLHAPTPTAPSMALALRQYLEEEKKSPEAVETKRSAASRGRSVRTQKPQPALH